MSLILSIFEQGLIYAVLSLGIYITYKILDFPDLTVDSSFPLGAAVSAIMISSGINPFITLPVSFICGALAGLVTGLIHVKCKVRDLLSGIITMTILYSINLHIADGKANIPLFNNDSIFSLSPIKGIAGQFNTVIVVLIISLIAKFLLDLYMKTKSGYLLRAVGDNPCFPCWLYYVSATEIFRYFYGYRYNGNWSCICYNRYKPFQKGNNYKGYNSCFRWFYYLQGLCRYCY